MSKLRDTLEDIKKKLDIMGTFLMKMTVILEKREKYEEGEKDDNMCECGNHIKQYEEGDDTMEMCEECR